MPVPLSHNASRMRRKICKHLLANPPSTFYAVIAKEKRLTICNKFLEMFKQNNFLYRIVTVDEVWVYWKNSYTHTHRSCRSNGDNPNTEPRRTLTKQKHLATVFWDSKGVIFMDVLPNGQTMTAVYYCELLDKLKIALQEKRR